MPQGQSLTAISSAEAPAVSGGLFARLGTWTGSHLRPVLLAWLVVLVSFGVFAPKVESALAGAGWQDSTSQSVQARQIIRKDFAGLGSSALQVVVADRTLPIAKDPAARSVISHVEGTLRANKDVSTVVAPRPGSSISRNGKVAVVVAGAAASTNQMVTAAGHLAGPLARLSDGHVSVTLTGDSALWADFNSANHSAMMRSEMLSWPVTLAILIVAFGSLIAAGLPLMLTIAGLLVAAGALVLVNHVTPVSIWALNFALMFSLALGIDYALRDIHLSPLTLVSWLLATAGQHGAGRGSVDAPVAPVALVAPSSSASWRRAVGSAPDRGPRRARARGRRRALDSSSVDG